MLSLIAVQVLADPSRGDVANALWDPYNRSTFNFLPSSSWYLIATQTDNAALARRLDAAGLPLNHLHGMIDSNCGLQASALVHAAVPSCGGTVSAQPGSRIANFLGAPSRETTTAFNHPMSHQPGYITLLEPSAAREERCPQR